MAENLSIDELCSRMQLAEEEEGGVGIDVDGEAIQNQELRRCLVSCFLSDHQVNFLAMKNTMAALWRPEHNPHDDRKNTDHGTVTDVGFDNHAKLVISGGDLVLSGSFKVDSNLLVDGKGNELIKGDNKRRHIEGDAISDSEDVGPRQSGSSLAIAVVDKNQKNLNVVGSGFQAHREL
ncbi:hypothetical protein DH2020_004245 [Rehmannia glutinosa]|uniref:Uncharacterized protein n=1 Tax=Rehmannia glutinosa TaxID=99300 RepID=A0ABR0XNY0_REHGL